MGKPLNGSTNMVVLSHIYLSLSTQYCKIKQIMFVGVQIMAVSQEYKDNIYTTPRTTTARIRYSLSPPGSKEGGEINLPPSNAQSRDWQIMNEIRNYVAPVLSIEPGRCMLDGSYMLPPEGQEYLEVGYWSLQMSDENGRFNPPLVIERIFGNVFTFNTLGITFDMVSGDCASDFDVEFFDGFGASIYREEVRGNTDTTFNTQQAGINVLRVVITIHSTNRPQAFIKILELDFGLVLTYNDAELQAVNMIREADHNGKRYMYPELVVSIHNDGNYDPFDIEGYAPYFLRRQRFDYEHGLVLPDGTVEWVYCGAFYLANWRIDDVHVMFIAKGATFELENQMFRASNFTELSLAALVRLIYPMADVRIDSPPITAYFGNINHRVALRFLIELSCCIVHEDKYNVLQFVDIVGNGTELPIVDEIRYENSYEHPQPRTQEFYNCILLSEYAPSVEDRLISRTFHEPGNITVKFSQPTQGELRVELNEGYTLTNAIWYTMYMTGTIVRHPNATDNEAELEIRGDSVTLVKTDTLYFAPWHTRMESDVPYVVDLPFFVRSAPNYIQMRDWFLARKFAVLRNQVQISNLWRGNPDRNIGDRMDAVFSRDGASQPMYMTRNELLYRGGALEGNIAVIGENPLLIHDRGQQT